jgi:hypothetical protein
VKILNKWLLTIVFVFAVILVTHAQEQTSVLYPGVHQAENWLIPQLPESIKLPAEGTDFGISIPVQSLGFNIHGTDISLHWQTNANMGLSIYRVSADGKQLEPFAEIQPVSTEGWRESYIALSTIAQNQRIAILPNGNETAIVDSITVLDRTYQNLAPLVGVAAIAVGMTLFVIFSALRERQQ